MEEAVGRMAVVLAGQELPVKVVEEVDLPVKTRLTSHEKSPAFERGFFWFIIQFREKIFCLFKKSVGHASRLRERVNRLSLKKKPVPHHIVGFTELIEDLSEIGT